MAVRVARVFPLAAIRQRGCAARSGPGRAADDRGHRRHAGRAGITLAPLARRAGIALAPDDVRQEHTAARLALAHAGLPHLEYLTETATAPESVLKQLRTIWQNRIEQINEPRDGEPPASIYRQLRQDLLDVENAELDRLYHDGAISDATRRQIQRSLDLEYTGLGEAPEAR